MSVTPTGRLVTDAPPESDEWFAARRAGITGTDLPKILGYSKYGNALSVWLDKRGEYDDEAGEAARWGNLLEDVIANEWAEIHDCYVEPVGVLAHVEHDHHRASLDRLVYHCPDGDSRPGAEDHYLTHGEPDPPDRLLRSPNFFQVVRLSCGLEVKTRSAFKAADWRDGIPDDTLAQVQWGLHVSGFDHMHVAALIGGQKLRTFRVDRDEKLIAYLIDAAEPVWQAVLDGIPPDAHPDRDGVLLDLLNRVYSKRAGERPVDPDEARQWVDQYLDASYMAKLAEGHMTEAKTALVQLLGDGDTGTVDDAPWFTYKAPRASDGVPKAELRRLAAEHPRVYTRLRKQGYITRSEPNPRFDLKRKRIETEESS